ncbi:hypothetical protein FACS1894170_11710 [Planctomycetales bacterium]|nr:hypothetical protein FACS1894170_11710 [Planctomycetales bacterium]
MFLSSDGTLYIVWCYSARVNESVVLKIAVTSVIAVVDLTQFFTWFAPAVRDIRMLRVE